jgi:hypothetical protein
MFKMAVGQSDEVEPADAIAAAIDACHAGLGDLEPQAGILFSSFDTFDPSVATALRDAFPTATVMGSTSAAEISSVGGYQEDSLTLAMFASDTVDVTTGLGTGLSRDSDAACRQAAAQALAATDREPTVCVMLAEAYGADPQATLDAMARALPDGVVIVGGASAGRNASALRPSYQFAGDMVTDDGVAVLLFSGALSVSTAVGTGWRMLGATGTVTRSTSGAVLEIDDRPATEFLARYLDVTGPASYGNPLSVVEAGGDEPYYRAISGTDPAIGSVFVAGEVPVGAVVQLTTADTEEILGGTRAALTRAVDGFPAGAEPEAALIFSCAVRRFLLGSRTRVETELARSILGTTIPMAGIYCYGEIGPVRGVETSRYFNETFVTVLLGT